MGQWLFVRYAARFVLLHDFAVLRNIAAGSRRTMGSGESISPRDLAAADICYGLAAYRFGEAFAT